MGALACLLALVLGSAAAHKLIDRARLSRATGRLLRLNPALALPATFAAAAVEAVAALALLMPATRTTGAAIAILLWLTYAAALHAAHRRGEDALDCGCSFGAHRKGLDLFTRARPLVLALFAAGLIVVPASIDVIAPFAGLALFAMYIAAAELAALPSTRSVA